MHHKAKNISSESSLFSHTHSLSFSSSSSSSSMAESSVVLCFSSSSSSTFPSSFPNLSRFSPAKTISFAKSSSPRFQSFRFIRCGARDSDDSFGLYPWDSPLPDADGAIEWVTEERVTLFTTDGLVQIGGSLIPKWIPSNKKKGRSKAFRRIERFKESDYMDPKQSLCLGALFNIAATNGLDMGRRLCIFGFCRSIEMLSDVVEDTVLEHGGEIVAAEKASKGGLQEKLTMTVAVPLLWGVPPASETLRLAVRSGGGIVDKVYWQWDFL